MSVKIVRFTAENVGVLKAVEITPEGNLIIIAGENAQGKSTVLNSIATTLDGAKSALLDPIRHGQSKASARVELDNGMTVEKTFTKRGERLRITTPDDPLPMPAPRSILGPMAGALTFDPLAFSAMKAPEQARVLQALTGLDFTKYNAARKKTYDDRADANRDAKTLLAHANTLPFFEDVPEEVDDDLYEQLNEAVAHNKLVDDKKHRIEMADSAIKRSCAEIATLTDELVAMTNDRDGAVKTLEISKDDLAKTGPIIDVRDIQSNIRAADEVKGKLAANTAKKDAKAAAKQAAVDAKALDAKLQRIDAAKDEAIAKSSLPVEGLTFDEDAVFYNNVPFEQASSAEKLIVSLEITAAMNPELHVVLCRDGSRLDKESMKVVAKWVDEHDYQLWLERVGHGDKGCIIIEDGSVVEGD